MQLPADVCSAYAIDATTTRHVPSLINDTFVAEATREGRRIQLVAQRLHPVFGREVHEDIDAVTRHLEARGLDTPLLVRTVDGSLDYLDEAEARPWRALTFVPGVTLHSSADPRVLESAAGLLARFHAALGDFRREFSSRRPLHDTPRHLEVLRESLARPEARADRDAQRLGAAVLQHAEDVRLGFPEQPTRIIHGDPKLSNFLFFENDPATARCLIDLDTVGRGALAFELGDAMRSWCNPVGEDASAPELDLDLVRAVLRGYLSACPLRLEASEIGSLIEGLETVSCELASRFAADAIRDCYFGWDATRFRSRREHNLLRGEAQLALCRQVRERRSELFSLTRQIARSSRDPR